MKKGRFLLLVWFLLSHSLFVYSEPPIEVIYWKSWDVQTPSQDEIGSLHDVMVEVQSFFASEMDRHGFGEKTFSFKDIDVVEGRRKLRDYTSHWIIVDESDLIERGLDNQIYVVFFGGSGHIAGNSALSQQLCGNIPEQLIYCNNLIVIPTESRHIILPLLAHEIGHAFSLDHPEQRLIANRVDVMHFPLHVIPGVTMTLKDFALSQKDATFLNEGGRLSVQQDSQDSNQEIEIDTDVNDDGYTDLYDCLIVRSGMSVESSYDTDINNDGVTNILDLMLVKAAAFEAIAAAAPSKPSQRKIITTTWGKLKTR
ncbi:hypothetical protein F4X10_16020 [Candidatus Poribacteria bacterium]|nr:hypothetical protein [Candidatus Poribacteria bacterium]